MTDIQAMLARYRALLEPEGPGRDTAYGREAHAARYADDSHAFLPGTWFMAGHHDGRIEIDRMWEAVRRIWPRGTRLFRNHFFVGEDTLAIEWWSRNQVWNGVQAQNSGVGRLRFRGDEVIDHHEITDSEYFGEVHGDWRGQLGPELGRFLPRYAQRRPPFYADPAKNDWALEWSPTDGRDRVPDGMRANFEAARAWWESTGDSSSAIFADDVRVFLQGRLWPLGGHHRGRAQLERLFEVSRRLWPRSRFARTNFWADPERVLVEWFREMETWRGQACREGGFTVWTFRGARVVDVRTYVDTSFHAEVLADWRDAVGEPLGRELPNWKEPGTPRYPRPEEHE
jgi:ketosteroid isomerase-like protein